MVNEVIFDLETKKLFDEVEGKDPAKLGVSVISVYSRSLDDNLDEIEGKMHSFWEEDLGGLWPIFQTAQRIVGFNSLGFDVPVLQPYANLPLNKLPHFDILSAIKEKLGRRISLNEVALHTLGEKKTDVGTNAVIYWQRGDKESLEKLKSYCEADVFLTKKVYDYGLKNRSINYYDRKGGLKELAVDFSHPKNIFTAQNQNSLF